MELRQEHILGLFRDNRQLIHDVLKVLPTLPFLVGVIQRVTPFDSLRAYFIQQIQIVQRGLPAGKAVLPVPVKRRVQLHLELHGVPVEPVKGLVMGDFDRFIVLDQKLVEKCRRNGHDYWVQQPLGDMTGISRRLCVV